MHSARLIFSPSYFTFKRFTHFQQPALFLCLFTRNHCRRITRQLKSEAWDHCSCYFKNCRRLLPSLFREGAFFGSKRVNVPFDQLFSRYQCLLIFTTVVDSDLLYVFSCLLISFLRIRFSLERGEDKSDPKSQKPKVKKPEKGKKTLWSTGAFPKNIRRASHLILFC